MKELPCEATKVIKCNTIFFLSQGSLNDPHYFLLSVCDELHWSGSKCEGSGVCLVSRKKTYKSLGLYAHRTMTYFKDEGMLILKYCSAVCDSKG